MHAYRSHTCGALRAEHVGQSVRLSGWVHRVRDHGGVLFIDLRDHYGMTQVIADPDSPAFKAAEAVRGEWVIRIDGTVKARDASLVNPKLATGEIEVYAREVEVLGVAEELPLPVFGEPDYPEETRLKYRFLDLRREKLHKTIVLRSKVIAHLRQAMVAQGFMEYQTPILTASSPEGARDFLVPSRLHPGKFYALPQAPQQFKQLAMVAGFDRYFQIAPCFRDEDPRADRSPGEFYQLDLEMSFVTQEDVFQTIEPVMRGVFETFGEGRKVTQDFPRIPYAEALLKYGSDKPDLRNPIEMQVVSEHFRGSGFKVFAQLLEKAGTEVRAIPAPGGGSRAFCDRMNSWAQKEGLPGMGYIFWRPYGDEEEIDNLQEARDLVQAASESLTRLSDNDPLKIALQKRRDDLTKEIFELLSARKDQDNYMKSKIAYVRDLLDRQEFQILDLVLPEVEEMCEAAGPIARNIGPERSENLRRQLGLKAGDAAFFVAGEPAKFTAIAGKARNEIWRELGMFGGKADNFELAWIVDFPMYEWDEERKKIDFSHNPFSMPQGGLEALQNQKPLDVLGYQYDIVCNGIELSSGAIRNHKPEIMFKAFEIAGYSREDVERRFGGMLNAFRYGAPPHGGIAPGVDRIVMLLAGAENIREVIMFPMNQKAEDPMMGAPSAPTNEQLRELGLRIVPKD